MAVEAKEMTSVSLDAFSPYWNGIVDGTIPFGADKIRSFKTGGGSSKYYHLNFHPDKGEFIDEHIFGVTTLKVKVRHKNDDADQVTELQEVVKKTVLRHLQILRSGLGTHKAYVDGIILRRDLPELPADKFLDTYFQAPEGQVYAYTMAPEADLLDFFKNSNKAKQLYSEFPMLQFRKLVARHQNGEISDLVFKAMDHRFFLSNIEKESFVSRQLYPYLYISKVKGLDQEIRETIGELSCKALGRYQEQRFEVFALCASIINSCGITVLGNSEWFVESHRKLELSEADLPGNVYININDGNLDHRRVNELIGNALRLNKELGQNKIVFAQTHRQVAQLKAISRLGKGFLVQEQDQFRRTVSRLFEKKMIVSTKTVQIPGVGYGQLCLVPFELEE